MRLAFLLIPLVACGQDTIISNVSVDADGDGYTTAVDCDDAHRTVNPDAPELCNGVDDDCDEQIDDDPTDGVATYADLDGDGYGDPATEATGCPGDAGRSEDAADCDDSDPEVHPDGTEVCGGVDEDCDGAIDEDAVGAPTWYADADEDTFGDPAVPTVECVAPAGTVADATDCDDGAASVSPAADEVCNDVDDDCNGAVDDAPTDPATWYADTDGDGFGNPDAPTDACTLPPGHSPDATDCDDDDATVSPAEAEVCNGVDDDCNGAIDDDPADPTTWYADTDADGFGDPSYATTACDAPAGYLADASDCDDADASVNPAAGETCDSVDEDCDGVVDDGASDADRWYADTDSDGFGDASSVRDSCDAPPGYVGDDTDCDDGDGGVHPTASETCDGVDEDCDGVVDDNATDPSTWYADADADGFGDPSHTREDCDAPSGYVGDDTDCDDTDGAVNPDVAEVCGDTVDQDCDGAAPACSGLSSRSLADADVEYWGAAPYDAAWVAASAGDFDLDGTDDVLVGAYGVDDAGAGAGAVYLVYGSASPTSMSLASADLQWTGEAAGDAAGYAVAGVGDVNADGYGDLLFGAYLNSDAAFAAGAAYLVLGSASPSDGSLSSAIQYTGEVAIDEAGFAVSPAGDVNADGFDDLLVGAWVNDDAGASAGAAYLVLGSGAPASSSLGTAIEYTGEAAGDYAGYANDALGDFDADGFDDILIGARDNDDGGSGAGAAYLVLGGSSLASMSLSSADAEYRGEVAGDIAGSRVSRAGDVDGDGYDDALVGALWNDDGGYSYTGAAYLVLGSAAPRPASLSAAIEYTGYAARSYAGKVAEAGDLDQDGYDDFLVTAQGMDANAGETFIVLGSSAPAPMSLTDADAVLLGVSANENTGGSVVGNLDVNADGALDVLVGAVLNNDGGTEAGAVYLVLGGS